MRKSNSPIFGLSANPVESHGEQTVGGVVLLPRLLFAPASYPPGNAPEIT